MKITYTVLMVLLSGVLLLCEAGICSYHRDARANEKEMEEVIEKVIHESAKAYGEGKEEIGKVEKIKEIENTLENVQIDFGKLKELNADTAGWIMFYDQCVSYPLVQTDDNSYYLNHSFRGNENAAGSIFVDCRNQSFDDRNVVVYGHNMLDRTMFGSLKDVFQEEFWEEENRDIIRVTDTENHVREYKIFSYYIVEAEDYYITTDFDDDADYAEFLNVIRMRSFRDMGVNVTVDDRILTLSTCAGITGTGRRRVIHAKFVEETPSG